MRAKSLVAPLAVVLLLTGSLAARAVVVQDVVDKVSQANYTLIMTNQVAGSTLYTHNGDSRVWGSAKNTLAATSIYNYFTSFGLATSYDPITYSFTGGSNVVAVLPGLTTPSQYYIIGAHFDSVSTGPGADDNASGVAGVIEAARILSQYRFDASLVFIGFNREEAEGGGLDGSQDYVNDHPGMDVRGMLSLDMIANNNDGGLATIIGSSTPNSAQTSLAAALTAYGEGLTYAYGGVVDASDHAPFRLAGKPAALLIEGNYANNPYYHKATDSVDSSGYLDYLYATRMTRSVVGWMATQAGLLAVPEPSFMLLIASGSWIMWWYGRRKLGK